MQQFKSMTELVEYLSNLEGRVRTLETENANLRAMQPKHENVDGRAIARYVAQSLPQTDLLSPGFFKRAFAVWGHFFVANLIIGLIIATGYACLMMVLFGSMFGGLIRQGNP